MSYQRTVEQLYALGHELASTPSHKFDPWLTVREMLEALKPSRAALCERADRRDERQRFNCGDAVVDPAGCRIQDRAVHLAAPGAHKQNEFA